MSEAQKFSRRPWWILGGNLLSSIVLTVTFTALSISLFFGRLAASGWQVAILVIAIFVVVAGIASIVHYARHPAGSKAGALAQENDPRQR